MDSNPGLGTPKPHTAPLPRSPGHPEGAQEEPRAGPCVQGADVGGGHHAVTEHRAAPGSTGQRDQWCCWQEVITSTEHSRLQSIFTPVFSPQITPEQAGDSRELIMIITSPDTLSPLPLLGTAKPARGCSTIGQTQVRGRVQEDPLVWSPEVSRLARRFRESEGGGVTDGSLLPPDSTSPSLPPPPRAASLGCHGLNQASIQST